MESHQLRLSGELMRLMAGYQVAQTIYAAASLGIADLLRDETRFRVLTAAKFELIRVVPTSTEISVVEAVPRG